MARLTLYRLLLKLYPASYRERYEHEMMQTVIDMLDDATTKGERSAVWLQVATDLPMSATKVQLKYMGGIMQNETPRLVRQSGIIAALCLMPFFLALITNMLNTIVYGHSLYNSWLWSGPILATWVLILPCVALLISGGAYLWFTAHNQLKATFVRRLFDVRHSWILMVPIVISIGILFMLLFHDSVHCWTGNPVHTVRNMHETWQCTTAGFLGGK